MTARFVLALAWIGLVPAFPLLGAEPAPSPAEWLPADAILAVEIQQPKVLLDQLLAPRRLAQITAMPGYQKAAAQPGFRQVQNGIAYFESQLGADWKTALGKLLGGQIAAAVDPQGGVVLIVEAEDAALLAKLHETVLSIVKAQAAVGGAAEQVKSTDYKGVTVWSLNKEEAHAIVGNRLVLSNRPKMVTAVLDLRGSGGKGLASLPAYQAARRAAGPGVGSAYVNMAAVRQSPAVQKGLAEGRSNPLGALMFAGVLESLRQSNWLALGLQIDGDRLSLDLAADGKVDAASGASAFTAPASSDQGVLPNLVVPRMVAGISLYRDLHGFYAAKDKLFPERTSGLIFFENMMGIFFSGRDLTEEVLAEAQPEIRFVVAEQQYDAKRGIPQIQIPAFAAVLRVRHPEQFAEVIEEAWQKAVGLVSFTSGQKGQPGLIIDRPTYGDCRYTIAYYSASSQANRAKLGIQYNFRPALVKLGEYVVLSSTEGLATDLIDALKKETARPAKALAGVHRAAELDPAQLASILRANRDVLVRQNMVEKGVSQEEAEGQIDILFDILRAFGNASLRIAQRDGQSRASLEINLNVASPRP